jgi:mono/diheme cytochrome c family protein
VIGPEENIQLRNVWVAGALFLSLFCLAACGNMRTQPKLAEPYAISPNFGVAARDILTQTVAVGSLGEDELLYNGTIDGQTANLFPFPITEEIMKRGQAQFNAFCAPCHGFTAYGDGVVVQQGFPAPPSLQTARMRARPVGLYFRVMTNGQDAMFSYASRISVEDRWAIVAYLRALQLSQNAVIADLPAEMQAQIQTAPTPTEEPQQ